MFIRVCNMCGKTLDTYDQQNGFGFRHKAGYGSKFDGEQFSADFCCECHDKIIDMVSMCCKHPIVTPEDDGHSHTTEVLPV